MEPTGRKPPWTMFWVMSVYMIGMFAWRVAMPAHEYATQSSVMLGISVDVLLLGCLVGLRSQAMGGMAPDDTRRALGAKLFWLGLAAGVGSLLIRFTSKAAWWTGHLMFELTPS